MIRQSQFLALVLLLLCGCQNTEFDQPNNTGSQYWPELPAQPRFVHEATIRSNLDIEIENEQAMIRRLLAGKNRDIHRFIKPLAIAASKGRIYISDTAINQIHVFDIPNRKYFRLGFRLQGKLSSPRGIAVDDSGKVYVVDEKQRRIIVYDGLGLFIKEIKFSNNIIRPTDIDISADGKRIFVVDSGGIDSDAHQILILDEYGNQISLFGHRGNKPGEFNLPNGITLTPEGYIAILDAGNFRVQILDQSGGFIRQWGQVGNGLGYFSRPRAITSDANGNIYVSDGSFTNVQVFNHEGLLLLPLGTRDYQDKNGALLLIAGIAVDETNRLYIIDQAYKKVEIFRSISEIEGKQLQLNFKQD